MNVDLNIASLLHVRVQVRLGVLPSVGQGPSVFLPHHPWGSVLVWVCVAFQPMGEGEGRENPSFLAGPPAGPGLLSAQRSIADASGCRRGRSCGLSQAAVFQVMIPVPWEKGQTAVPATGWASEPPFS